MVWVLGSTMVAVVSATQNQFGVVVGPGRPLAQCRLPTGAAVPADTLLQWRWHSFQIPLLKNSFRSWNSCSVMPTLIPLGFRHRKLIFGGA
jgi:hypothetical protein